MSKKQPIDTADYISTGYWGLVPRSFVEKIIGHRLRLTEEVVEIGDGCHLPMRVARWRPGDQRKLAAAWRRGAQP